MSKDEIIKQYMESLQISIEEATQLWEDDQEDYIGEDGEEMTTKAKSIKRYEQSAEPRKERKPREIKKDEENCVGDECTKYPDDTWLKDIITVLLLNEMYRRRRRRNGRLM